jgi:hypothetical protein
MQVCVMGLFICRWRYGGVVLPQDRLLSSFFWGMEDQQLTNSRTEK